MRAATPGKQAMRTLWHAGRYVKETSDQRNLMDALDAMIILSDAYNQLLRSNS